MGKEHLTEDESTCLDTLDLHLWTDLTRSEEDEIARREKLFAEWRPYTDKNPNDAG